MNTNLPRPITPDEIETYDRDGVVLLPGFFDADWIEVLVRGLDANRNEPTTRSRIYDRDDAGRTAGVAGPRHGEIKQSQERIGGESIAGAAHFGVHRATLRAKCRRVLSNSAVSSSP